MGIWEILLIAACAAIVISVIITSVIRKKRGKTSCDCCSDCEKRSACRKEEDKKI